MKTFLNVEEMPGKARLSMAGLENSGISENQQPNWEWILAVCILILLFILALLLS